jgi:hypothetical protein
MRDQYTKQGRSWGCFQEEAKARFGTGVPQLQAQSRTARAKILATISD